MLPLFGGAIAAFGRLRKDIETQPTIDNTSTAAEKLTNVNGAIEFRNVAFTYSSRPDHPVLNGISLECEAGMYSFSINKLHAPTHDAVYYQDHPTFPSKTRHTSCSRHSLMISIM